jgi:hypothetical protein
MSITWSCVARDDIILAKAGPGDENSRVARTAEKITSMKPTCGWEVTRSYTNAPYQGIKFHLHEANDNVDGRMIVWSFCCVHNSKSVSQDCAKAYLSELVSITEPLRRLPLFREGSTLSAQPSFEPILLQQMEDSERIYQRYVLNQRIERIRAIMQENIEAVLNRCERMDHLENEAQELDQMARVFKKKSREARRYQMLQIAQHGVMLGTAITTGVAIIALPLAMIFGDGL